MAFGVQAVASSHEYRTAPFGVAGFQVLAAVSHHDDPFKTGEMKMLGDLLKQAGEWLAAAALVVGVMGAVGDEVDAAALGFHQLLELLVHGIQLIGVVVAAADA